MASTVPASGGRGTRTCMASDADGQMLLRDGDRDKRRVAVEGEALRAPPRARPPAIFGGKPVRTLLVSIFGGDADVSVISKIETSDGTAIEKGCGGEAMLLLCVACSGCRWPCGELPGCVLYCGCESLVPSCATIVKSKSSGTGDCLSRLQPGSSGVTDDLLTFECSRVCDISYLTIDARASNNC